MTRTLTLSEVESSLRKCARAVGLEWGIAEEAGKAARWLAAYGLPGPEFALSHLLSLRAQDYSRWAPDVGQTPWRAGGDNLCPIITGAAVADRSDRLVEGQSIEITDIAYPLLLVAVIGQAARCRRTAFTIRWADVEVQCFEDGIGYDGNQESLRASHAESLICDRLEQGEAKTLPSTTAYPIDESVLAEIEKLAFETYAPATAQSRAGAGAGLTDND